MQAPRDHYIKDPYSVIPDDDCAKLGISALCGAMTDQQKVAIVRVKLRANSALFLGVLTPFRATPSSLDCFILNTLPYAEDIRYYPFASLGTVPDRVPNEAQLASVQKVITRICIPLLQANDRIAERDKPSSWSYLVVDAVYYWHAFVECDVSNMPCGTLGH